MREVDRMRSWAWLIPALPAIAAVVGLFVSRRLPGQAAGVAVLGTAASLVMSLIVLAQAGSDPSEYIYATHAWTPTGGINLQIGTAIDGFSAVIAVMVAVIALLVQVYSIGYMAGDHRYSTYAAEVSLFTAAMLLVVVSSDLFELLIGWEVMGLCSYLLIGHYWQTEGARAAAVKAFVTNRIGDTGFLFGIFVLGVGAKTFSIDAINGQAVVKSHRVGIVGHVPVVTLTHTALVAGALLLLAGVVGKSAQFPLHVWLPDAMAGPTPISALIHAATMVAAGIFVVARLYPVFVDAPVSLTVLGIIACITMLGAALAALAEDDLKRVLAWSTVSQLAYMAAGLAVRGWTAGIYHLLTHAAFKALLFLAAGSVLRSVGTNLMSQMGGLRRAMPVTFVTALVGAGALAGLPPFAGAFSKDGVLAAARSYGGGLGTAVYVVGLVTVFVTAAYVTRLVVRTFFGSYRGVAAGPLAHVHESPRVMTVPLVVLAVAAIGLGLPVVPSSYGVARWLDPPFLSGPLEIGIVGVLITTAISLAGVAGVMLLHRAQPERDPVAVLGRAATPLARAFWVDDIYDRLLVRPLRAFGRAVVAVDRRGVDAAVVGAGTATSGLGGRLRRLQNGNIQSYASGLVIGVIAIVVGVSLAVAR
jgi:NADH-quinone oxidoreductase subunit L